MKLEEEEDDERSKKNKQTKKEIKVTNIIKYFMVRLTYTYI